jgi:hypothetical protein
VNLSAAIRLGAMLKPQGFNSHDTHASCALRAAADAVGIDDILTHSGPILNYVELTDRWPYLFTRVECPPEMGGGFLELVKAIYLLNDAHHWTRERIADFVETVERAELAARVDQGGVPC